MPLSLASPVVALRNYVRCFQQREAHVGEATIIFPIAARPEQFLEFYLKQRYVVHTCETGMRDFAPGAVVVGPCTVRRVELVLHGSFDVFTVHFQPAGFHQLFGVPMAQLTDRAYEARSVVGPTISEIEERLADASGFGERIDIATGFLLQHITGRAAPNAVAIAANRVLDNCGGFRIREAAVNAGLSVRQFERRFCEQVGISPKRYARIVRFYAALSAKLAAPKRAWTDIAHEIGYYDQMHMVHDFQRFSGESPTNYFARFKAMPTPWV
jgi:AraC-like DNA-binding protein